MTGDGVLVVGAGFAGFWAAVAARRVGGPGLPVTLVSREAVLQLRPRLYEAEPHRLGVDLRPLLDLVGVEFVPGEAVGVDTVACVVHLADGGRLRYERLVVATGSAMHRPAVPGAGSAYSIDTVTEAVAFDRRLAVLAARDSAPALVVVGGGFTGIELALELRDRLAGHGAGPNAERARVVLVDRAPCVGPDLGPGPRPVIEQALARDRVELRLGTGVAAIGADHVVLGDGATVEAEAVVLTTGMTAAGFTRHIPCERDELGRVLVDRTLRAPDVPHVFVAGDAACAVDGDGHRVLQSCQHALQLGRFAGDNAARDLLDLPALPYEQPPYVTCLDLGRYGAVATRGWDRTVRLSGARAKVVKRRINTVDISPPSQATQAELLAWSVPAVHRELLAAAHAASA